MKKLLVAAVFVAGLCGGSFGAECDDNIAKLRAAEYELGLIHHTLQGNDVTASVINLGYALNDYAVDCGDIDDCINELKPRYKELFKQKGLKWSEANIKAEYQKATKAREKAEKACEKAKKQAILD